MFKNKQMEKFEQSDETKFLLGQEYNKSMFEKILRLNKVNIRHCQYSPDLKVYGFKRKNRNKQQST